MRICRVITEGGDQPKSARQHLVALPRPHRRRAQRRFEQGRRIAQGAAQISTSVR
jgi:hypothetical protein